MAKYLFNIEGVVLVEADSEEEAYEAFYVTTDDFVPGVQSVEIVAYNVQLVEATE